MSDLSERQHIINATLKKVLSLASQHSTNMGLINDHKRLIAEVEEKNAELLKLYDQCIATAALFGFDVDEEFERLRSSVVGPPASGDPPPPEVPPPTVEQLAAIAQPHEKSIREIILEIAKEAYPGPVRARSLQQILAERYMRKVHEKTCGMTLYRLYKHEGAVKRSGKADWYFVPEGERKLPSGEEPGGDTPGNDIFE